MKETGNVGEWSELYTLVYLLSIGKLYAADENLQKLSDVFFPIKYIFHDEDKNKRRLKYDISDKRTVAIYLNNKYVAEISQEELGRKAKELLCGIINKPEDCKRGAFSITCSKAIMDSILCKEKKHSDMKTKKADIRMEIHDVNTGLNLESAFSIKSYLGGAPTLLNPSDATNFIFKINGKFTKSDMNKINAIEKCKDGKIIARIKAIQNCGGKLEFCRMNNDVFSGNLSLFDTKMDKMLAEIVLDHYENNVYAVEDLVEHLEKKNPLHVTKKGFYKYKIIKFLCAVALGMTPTDDWDGKDEANGGYITVTSTGDVLAYHLYNRDAFENYLLRNTRLERSSTTRYHYATIYEEGNSFYIKLCLQIRFKQEHF